MLRPPRVRLPIIPDPYTQGQKEMTQGCHLSLESWGSPYIILRDAAWARLGNN